MTTQLNANKKSTGHPWPQARPWAPAEQHINTAEQRRSPRLWRSGPISFHEPLQGQPQTGWMLDHSASGAAFLVRGAAQPLAGMRVQTDLLDQSLQPLNALVRRVDPIHSDLFLVAVQYAGVPLNFPN